MKKVLTLMFAVTLLLSACGQSAPATVSQPEVTEAPINTSVPEATSTPEASPTPEMLEPYAVISGDKAEFWFPLSQQTEWEWFGIPVLNNRRWVEYSWSVRFEVDKAYEVLFDITNQDNSPIQKGDISQMLNATSLEITELPSIDGSSFDGYFTGLSNATITSVDGGVLITLAEPSLVSALNAQKPETVLFSFTKVKDFSNPEKPAYEWSDFTVTPTYK